MTVSELKSKIVELAVNAKSSKAKSFGAVEKIIDYLAVNNDNIDGDVMQGLAQLYCQFLPAVKAGSKKDHRDDLKWVALAVERSHPVYSLRFIKSDGRRIIGCDGHLMHVVETGNYPIGYYDIAGNEAAGEHSYPEIDPALDTALAGEKSILAGKTIKSDGYIDGAGRYTIIKDGRFRYDNLKKMVGDNTVDMYYSGPDKPLAVKYGNRIAVLMPLRRDL